ncbi:hypothetical protein Ndes2526B_g01145 [Nannochloris sp. 'desiccata']
MLREVEAPSNEAGTSITPPTNASPSFPLAAGFAASSISVSSAVFMTNWVDVIKIRQQVAGPEGKNLFSTGVSVVRNEGVLALYRGVTPAVLRGMLYGGLRIGLYSPFKQALSSEAGEDPGLGLKIVAGMGSGAVAAGICNPTDLVKTRMQVAGAIGRSSWGVTQEVIREEGVIGLWKGTTPSMVRAALLTAAQCATYDEVKLLFTRQLGWEDGVGTHLAVSGVAGLVTTTVTAPVDMIKTNMFVNPVYNGPWDCVKDIYRRMGVRGLFKGWSANWARQGPMTTLVFVVNETVRPIFGLGAL